MVKIFAPTKAEVTSELKELHEVEEKDFVELSVTSFQQLTDRAALIDFPLREFAEETDKRRLDAVWFPLSMMRQLEGGFYFNTRIAQDKGLRVK